MQMMFQMETHYFLSPFQCFCYFGEDDGEQLHLKSVLLLWDWPEGNHSFTRETLVPKAACLGGFYHTGILGLYYSSTIWLTNWDV